ncbi:hypothetical protein GYH30_031341 [Glycine max]|nr:hypothetical protein GYH30_031341 [Glycine max]
MGGHIAESQLHLLSLARVPRTTHSVTPPSYSHTRLYQHCAIASDFTQIGCHLCWLKKLTTLSTVVPPCRRNQCRWRKIPRNWARWSLPMYRSILFSKN